MPECYAQMNHWSTSYVQQNFEIYLLGLVNHNLHIYKEGPPFVIYVYLLSQDQLNTLNLVKKEVSIIVAAPWQYATQHGVGFHYLVFGATCFLLNAEIC